MRRSLLSVGLALGVCATLAAHEATTTRPYVVGRLEAKELDESSGVVESRKYPGVYWTHNDSGNAPVIYAVRRDGSLINAFPVRGVAVDWEDIAIDDAGHLYLADIGNNFGLRKSVGVLRVDEPDPNVAPEKKHPLEVSKRWTLTYAQDKRIDCESLFIWKESGYVIKKSPDGSPSTLWRFSLEEQGAQPLALVATLPVKSIICGADLSVDGDRLALMASDGPILLSGLAGDLSKVADRMPASIHIEPRTNEGICFTRDGLLGTSEARDVYFFPFEAFNATTTQPGK